MVDPQKVRALTRIELFEHQKGRQVFKIKEYCEDIPVWKGFSRSAAAGLILCVLVLVLIVLLAPELIENIRGNVGDFWMAVILAFGMAVFAAIYCIVSDIIFRRKYIRIRSTLCGYKSEAARLKKISQGQETL